MKMVKSLLLGSAAGLLALTGAQAADLPVKAKPVEYVRICSAYGAGFYYIPGTDICLRVGGYAFIEAGYNARAGVPLIYNYNIGADLVLNRDDNRTNWRTRGTVILDARSQSAIGTVRTYIAFGADYNNNVNGAPPPGNVTAYLERAFIQFAGFTVGQAATFFDFGGYYSIMAWANIAWNWNPVFAYTAQFGNGVSATISIEDGQAHRTKLTTGTFTGVSTVASAYGGQQLPNLVGNIRIDQAWGSAQIMGAIQQLRVNQVTSATINDSYGYAVGAGIEIKLPMLAPGDSIVIQGVYSRGAVEYTGLATSPLASALGVGLKNAAGLGPASDIFDAYFSVAPFGATLQRSIAWSANVMFRHFWTPAVRSAFWVGYNFYNPGGNAATATGADPNLRIWQVGGNVIWSPAPTLDLSLDLLWTDVRTGVCAGAAVAVQIANCAISRDQLSVWTRWRRNF